MNGLDKVQEDTAKLMQQRADNLSIGEAYHIGRSFNSVQQIVDKSARYVATLLEGAKNLGV
jgi:hypothetical protein